MSEISMIRMASYQDAGNIAQVHVDSWRAAYHGMISEIVIAAHTVSSRTAVWQQVLEAGEWPVFVAEVDSRIVGFCHLAPSRDDDAPTGTIGEIAAIYVIPGEWGVGHGSDLCRIAEQELARRGLSEATLWVFEKNLAARRFYEARGFRRDGASKVHEPSGAVEVRYRKALPHGR